MYLVTLTTDFDIQSHHLSIIKATILKHIPQAVIIDISHDVRNQNLQQAIYFFKQAYPYFPNHTIHLVLTNIYEQNAHQKLLYTYENKHHIFSADNGFLTLLFNEKPIQLFKLTEYLPSIYNYISIVEQYMIAAIEIINQSTSCIAPVSVNEIMVKKYPKTIYKNNIAELQIIYIDEYGNVITNITQFEFEELKQNRPFKIILLRDIEINTLHTKYNDVQEGNVVCFFNTAHHLEIAVNKGNAATLFGLETHTDKSLFYHIIKIYFE